MTDDSAPTLPAIIKGMNRRLAQLNRTIKELEPAVLRDAEVLKTQTKALSKRRQALRAMMEEQFVLARWQV